VCGGVAHRRAWRLAARLAGGGGGGGGGGGLRRCAVEVQLEL